MHFSIRGITRKTISLTALAMPLTLLILAACGGGGGGGGAGSVAPPTSISLVNGQAATVVIGQPNFTTATPGATATTFASPWGNPGVDAATGNLYVADYANSRTLVYNGIPTANGASAAYAIGQLNLTSNITGATASEVAGPQGPVVANGQLFVAEATNNRVSIYSPAPTGSPGVISTVLGQASFTTAASGCAATSLNMPATVAVGGGKVVVVDSGNNRVLIWNSVPAANGAAANLVLGQTSMTSCARNQGLAAPTASTLGAPTGAWTDGNRLVVLDQINHRALIWKTLPTVNGQAADLVLGQASFTSAASGVSATSLQYPAGGAYVNAFNQLFVTDTGNNRVLVWNSFPTANGQAADVVLGQPNFTTNAAATTATGLSTPVGVTASGNHVLVSDMLNNRVLVY